MSTVLEEVHALMRLTPTHATVSAATLAQSVRPTLTTASESTAVVTGYAWMASIAMNVSAVLNTLGLTAIYVRMTVAISLVLMAVKL